MAIAFVADSEAGSIGGTTVTTAGIDTTGANLIVLEVVHLQGTNPTVSDFYGNTWTPLTLRNAGGGHASRLHYCLSPSVGSGHTFTASQSTSFPSIHVEAFSGVGAYDQESGAGAGSGTVQPGSLTPPSNGALFVCGLGNGGGSGATINSSFNKTSGLDTSGGNHFGGAIAYLIQGTAGAVNPTWSSTNGGDWTAVMATFTEAAAAAGLVKRLLLMGVGA
jgi:hypothetical protein